MSKHSVTGHFRDIEIAFSIEGGHTYMGVRNLISDERQVRVMYQKLAMSGLANWRQFQLTNRPVLLRLPAEVLEAHRLTFFVDNADPISARIEKILTELDQLRIKFPVGELVEDPAPVVDTPYVRNDSAIDPPPAAESETDIKQHAEEEVAPNDLEVDTAEPEQLILPEKEQEPTETSSPIRIVPKSRAVNVDNNLEFKITIPPLPASARAEQRKAQATGKNGTSYTDRATSKQKRERNF